MAMPDDDRALIGERLLPDRDHGRSPEPERHVRYTWAAALVAGGSVLDAGCGAGWGTAVLAEHAKAVGVDISAAALAEANERYGERPEFIQGDLRRLPHADGTFDAVRLRTENERGCLGGAPALAFVYKLRKLAERHWRRLNGSEIIVHVLEGKKFQDGVLVQEHAA